MKEISVFREKLHEHLQWNGARLLFVSMFLIALMRVKTVNLVEIVMKIPEPWVISMLGFFFGALACSAQSPQT